MEGRIYRGSQELNHQPEDQAAQIQQPPEERYPQPSVWPDINNGTEILQRKRNERVRGDGGTYRSGSELSGWIPANAERRRRSIDNISFGT